MKQFITVLFVAGLAFLVGAKYYDHSPFFVPVNKAVALIYPTDAGRASGNEVSGKVIFTPMKSGIRVEAELNGLKPGKHGFHIHEFGNCLCPAATCAGDHYNPHKKNHGGPKDGDRHVGDLGNIEADAKGYAHLVIFESGLSLNGSYSIIGRSVIIHENEDDLTTQPTGNAGGRIACGVIGIAKAE